MATLFISEFVKLAVLAGKASAVALAPPVAEQTVSIAGASAPASAINAATKYVRLHTDAACSVSFGGTASATTMRMAANQTEYFGVSPGVVISVITNS